MTSFEFDCQHERSHFLLHTVARSYVVSQKSMPGLNHAFYTRNITISHYITIEIHGDKQTRPCNSNVLPQPSHHLIRSIGVCFIFEQQSNGFGFAPELCHVNGIVAFLCQNTCRVSESRGKIKICYRCAGVQLTPRDKGLSS